MSTAYRTSKLAREAATCRSGTDSVERTRPNIGAKSTDRLELRPDGAVRDRGWLGMVATAGTRRETY